MAASPGCCETPRQYHSRARFERRDLCTDERCRKGRSIPSERSQNRLRAPIALAKKQRQKLLLRIARSRALAG